jgi:tRNA (adenine37-N6)-methyltransferase
MVRENEIRKSEVAVTSMPAPTDAGLVFTGRIRTPWTSRMETPRQGRADGPLCHIEVFEPWVAALAGLEQYDQVEVLYWHEPVDDLHVLQMARGCHDLE